MKHQDGEYEEIEQTEAGRAERILAAGMIIFMLIGGVWILNRMSSLVPYPDRMAMEVGLGVTGYNEVLHKLQTQLSEAERLYAERAERMAKAQAAYEFRREEYRVLMEQGTPGESSRETYEAARADYEAAVRDVEIAVRVRDRAREDLSRQESEISGKQQAVSRQFEAALRSREIRLFLLRCIYVLPALAASFLLWQRMRRARSKYLIIGTSLLAFTTLQGIVVTAQYSWHLLRGLTQIVVSLAGTAICAAALVALKRYVLSPARVSRARLRKGQCQHCGFPAGAGARYCVACGGSLMETCSSCGNPRPVNAVHCPSCGK
ncbi:MAG: double zinc ribbon domain-containing protein [Ignavibacteriales bacterium]